ncbi:hypothetical protein E3U43_016465 [Larimichthys crocea]|uniref:Uncharacterized protein n=1 Tax=Larimichthys crocea TaxID=215358 RepID=A0ACD3QJ21_LARCR|nr:hypothetical protein E3U43_016465 [Larimichthys crocea]
MLHHAPLKSGQSCTASTTPHGDGNAPYPFHRQRRVSGRRSGPTAGCVHCSTCDRTTRSTAWLRFSSSASDDSQDNRRLCFGVKWRRRFLTHPENPNFQHEPRRVWHLWTAKDWQKGAAFPLTTQRNEYKMEKCRGFISVNGRGHSCNRVLFQENQLEVRYRSENSSLLLDFSSHFSGSYISVRQFVWDDLMTTMIVIKAYLEMKGCAVNKGTQQGLDDKLAEENDSFVIGKNADICVVTYNKKREGY